MVYTEVDATPVLCDPDTRVVHRLSPAAAALWARLDGRPLADHQRDFERLAPTPGHRVCGLPEGAVVDVIRRLRAVGLVEDAPDREPVMSTGPIPPATASAAGVEAAGTRVARPGRRAVVLQPWRGDPPRVTIEVPTGSDHDSDVLGFLMPGASPGVASPATAFELLVTAASPRDLVASIDGLAQIAELSTFVVATEASELTDWLDLPLP